MVQGFRALLSSGICSIALVAVHVQAATSGSEAGVRQARCPLALVQLNASPGLISVSKEQPNTSAISTTSTTSKGEVQKIEDNLKNVTSKAVNATQHISTAAGGVLANAWNATEDAASDAALWAGKAASGVKHALGTLAHAVSNVSEEAVSSIEDTMGGTANSSNSSSNSSNVSEGIVGHFVDEVADDVDGASQAVAEVVGSGWNSHANASKHHGSKHNSSAKSNHGCVTQDTENAQALYSYVSPAGSPCLFGVDERDEGSHCIDQAGEYGPNGWCWTSEDLESWGKCSNGCPVSGADAELEKRLQRIEKKLDKVEAEIRSH